MKIAIGAVVAVGVLMFPLAGAAWAQTPAWAHTWGADGDEVVSSMALSPVGDVYLSGLAAGPDLLLMKYATDGMLTWVRSYDWGSDHMYGWISLAPDGDLVVSGSTSDNDDAVVARFDGSGSLKWGRIWTPGWSHFNGPPVFDIAGNIYLAGNTTAISGNIDVILFKYDPSGSLLWAKSWHRQINNTPYSLVKDAAGNLYCTGHSGDWAATGNQDVILMKFDPEGNLLWDRIWSSAREYGLSLAVAADGSLYVSGFIGASGQEDVLVLKFDNSGNHVWARTWGGPGEEIGEGIAVGSDGNIYVTGSTSSFGAGMNDVFLLKYDTAGALLSQKVWGGAGQDGGNALAATADGGLLVAGFATNASGTWQDVSGTIGTPVGTVDLGPGVLTPFATSDAPFPLTETSYPGTIDAGGGGQDALLLKLITCSVDRPPCLFNAADVNCDGVIDVFDVLEAINETFMGKPIRPPCCRFQ